MSHGWLLDKYFILSEGDFGYNKRFKNLTMGYGNLIDGYQSINGYQSIFLLLRGLETILTYFFREWINKHTFSNSCGKSK